MLSAVTLMVVAAAAVLGGAVWPLWERRRQLDDNLVLVQTRLARLRALAGRAPAQAVDDGLADQPPARLQRAFLDELEHWSSAGHLQMNLKPQPPVRDRGVLRLGVELELEGAQADLLAFLDRVLASPALLEVARLKIAPGASPERPVRAWLTITRVVFGGTPPATTGG